MAGDWIPIRINLHDDPAVLQMAALLNVSPLAVVGGLVRVWGWANANLASGNARGVTSALLDALTGVTGFADAMASVGWLVIHAPDSAGDQSLSVPGIEFPNFERWNSQGAKRRVLANRRVSMHRANRNARSDTESDSGNADVTHAALQKDNTSVTSALTREEKRREEKKDNTPLPPKGGQGAEIPPSLDSPEFRAAWADWLADRKSRRKPVTERAARDQLAALAPLGPPKAVECLRESIRNGWTGIFPERFRDQHPPRGPTARGAAQDNYAVGILFEGLTQGDSPDDDGDCDF